MDLQSLLCGMYPRTRNTTDKKTKTHKPKRKHLPLPTGKYTVGALDIITDYGKNGVFMRLYYPTNSADIQVRPHFIIILQYLSKNSFQMCVIPIFHYVQIQTLNDARVKELSAVDPDGGVKGLN